MRLYYIDSGKYLCAYMIFILNIIDERNGKLVCIFSHLHAL